jgi:hypothetical protein
MSLFDFIVGSFGVGILVLPGLLIARARALPHPLLAGFIISVVALVGIVLALDALGAPLALGVVLSGWGMLVVVAALYSRRYHLPIPQRSSAERFKWKESWPLLLPLAPLLAVVAYRACAQPLFGVDNVFRWNYLAEQMLARHSLEFYPPVTAADYEVYSWPDGIAPVVSSLYFWIYSLGGSARPALTAPLIILQVVLVVVAVYALARKTFSARAALFACALAACSPLIAWATAMGQETGLTAIALTALLLYLPRNRDEERPASIVVAAAAAGLGALAREYGFVLIVMALGLCVSRRLSLRALGVFGATAFAIATPWYIRNWTHTGNPFFNLAVGEWFPVNPVHSRLNESFQLEYGWSNLPPEAPRLFVVNCLAALAGGIAGGLLHFRAAKSLVVAAACVVVVWIASLSYTAAGFIYSMRVLNPALCLAAVLGGAALARWVPGPANTNAVVFALCLFATDSALRALTLPANVYRVPPSRWLGVGNAIHEYHQRPIYREFVRVAGDQRILVLGPNALLTTSGARTVPLWSPEVQFLFDPRLSPSAVAPRLQALNIGFVLLNTGKVNERFLAGSGFFRNPPDALRPVWSDEDMAFYRVYAGEPLK